MSSDIASVAAVVMKVRTELTSKLLSSRNRVATPPMSMPIMTAGLLVVIKCFKSVRSFFQEFSGSACVDQSAQRTRSGCKSNLMARARSLFNPNASIPFTNCEMLPGKIAIKKSAVVMPTALRFCSEMSARPSAISTTPDASTTKSGEKGAHGGTCAWNSRRFVVRCNVPV